jgi:hypothetical protein
MPAENKKEVYWYVASNKKYFDGDENFAKNAIEYIKNNLEKYASNKYKEYKIVVVPDNTDDAKELASKNKIPAVKNNKIVDDLYNMEAEFFVEYENKYVLKKR